jgi:hypothetical protein
MAGVSCHSIDAAAKRRFLTRMRGFIGYRDELIEFAGWVI